MQVEQAEDGYDICPICGHHTSAAVGGRCTVFILDEKDEVKPCNCDCYKAIHGVSLSDVITRALRGEKEER